MNEELMEGLAAVLFETIRKEYNLTFDETKSLIVSNKEHIMFMLKIIFRIYKNILVI